MNCVFTNHEGLSFSFPIIGYGFKQTHETQPVFGKVFFSEHQFLSKLLGKSSLFIFDGNKYYSFKEFAVYHVADAEGLLVAYFKCYHLMSALTHSLGVGLVKRFAVHKYLDEEHMELSIRHAGWVDELPQQWIDFKIIHPNYKLHFDQIYFDTVEVNDEYIYVRTDNWCNVPIKIDYQKEGF